MSARHAARFPMRALGGAITLTLVFVGIAAFNTWRIYDGFRQIVSTDLRLQELAGKIIHLDEVLTMSARMSAVSGDLAWEARYLRFEPELDAAIKEAIRIAPDAYETHAASATDAANLALVDMEHRSFSLVRTGRLDQARRVMFGADYDRQKRIYAAGMKATMRSLKARAHGRIEAYGRGIRVSLIASVLVLALLLFGWVSVIRVVRGHLQARNAAEAELRQANATLEERVDERTRDLQASFAQLEEAQDRVVSTARAAGMAEVAVGVLHNVGNALNSVNVSARMAREVIGKCRIGSLQKAAALLADAKDLPAFVLSEKGRILPGFLVQATGEVAASLEKAGNDLATLQTHVDHIKRVVSTQQAFARVKAHVEEFDLAEAVEAAVQLSATTASKRGARITSRIPRGTLLVTDKHRVVQILLNLVSNACHAVADVQSDLRRVEISADAQGDRIVVRVRDQGAGISPDVMKQLFRHGFTTRKDGHGFGLHSSANAATEVGGSLRAESDGADRGATFVLDIPREMAKEQSAAA